MSDYAGMSSVSLPALHTESVPAREEQVKRMDDALNVLDKRLEVLAARLGPALRPALPLTLADESAKALDQECSDIVMHLRHTVGRITSVSRTVDDLTQRLDI